MNKSPDFPKVSFLVARPTLQKVEDYATEKGLTVSQAMRDVIEVGLQTIEKAAEIRAAMNRKPLGENVTRGKFPAPTGGHFNGSAA